MGNWDGSGMGDGWYNYPGLGVLDKLNAPDIFCEAGGNCSAGCLFHIITDQYEFHDVSSDYPEIMDYFNFLLDAIYRGGFDESYHSGQPFEVDYRGVQADGILRPYLNPNSLDEYRERLSSTTHNDDYDCENFSLCWFGEYDGEESPF